jgi:hypothetical protein
VRSSSGKRSTSKERELEERVRELEERLAASVPTKAEFEAVKSNLQLEINDLKAKLSGAEIHAPTPDLSGAPGNAHREEDSGVGEPQRIEGKREDNGLRAELSSTESSAEDPANGGAEDSEASDSEDAEDSDEPESEESSLQPQVTDQ